MDQAAVRKLTMTELPVKVTVMVLGKVVIDGWILGVTAGVKHKTHHVLVRRTCFTPLPGQVGTR